MAAPSVQMEKDACDKEKPPLSEAMHYPEQFSDPLDNLDHFVPSLPNLNHPVKSLEDKCNEIGLITFGEPVPLQELLADLVQLPSVSYRLSLMSWLHTHQVNLLPICNWLASQGLVLDDYVSHMLVPQDSLMVWSCSCFVW